MIEALLLRFSYYTRPEAVTQSRHHDSELICTLRVKPGHGVAQESFACELLEPIDTITQSMFEDGEELISNIVRVTLNTDNTTYKVPHSFHLFDLSAVCLISEFGSLKKNMHL